GTADHPASPHTAHRATRRTGRPPSPAGARPAAAPAGPRSEPAAGAPPRSGDTAARTTPPRPATHPVGIALAHRPQRRWRRGPGGGPLPGEPAPRAALPDPPDARGTRAGPAVRHSWPGHRRHPAAAQAARAAFGPATPST